MYAGEVCHLFDADDVRVMQVLGPTGYGCTIQQQGILSTEFHRRKLRSSQHDHLHAKPRLLQVCIRRQRAQLVLAFAEATFSLLCLCWYPLLQRSKIHVAPGCSALVWNRLMGTKVLATSFNGAPYLRAYAHCQKNTTQVIFPCTQAFTNVISILISFSFFFASLDIKLTEVMCREECRCCWSIWATRPHTQWTSPSPLNQPAKHQQQQQRGLSTIWQLPQLICTAK